MHWHNSILYEGQVSDNLSNGYGREIYENGAFYTGYFQKSMKHGAGTIVCEDGKVLEGAWENDELVQQKLQSQ